MPLLCGLHTGMLAGTKPSERAIDRVSAANYAPPLSVWNSSRLLAGMASTAPERISTASISISRGKPLHSHARQAITSRSQHSLVNVAVTLWPESRFFLMGSSLDWSHLLRNH